MFKVNAVSHKNFSEIQKEVLDQTIVKLETVFNSQKFKEQVVNFKCPLTGKEEFLENLGHSNEQLYDKLMSGATLHVEIDTDLPSRRVIGYTYPKGVTIYTYKWWFDKYAKKYYAAHLAHEWCHKLNFDHTARRKKRWKYTVPYMIGNIVEELTNE